MHSLIGRINKAKKTRHEKVQKSGHAKEDMVDMRKEPEKMEKEESVPDCEEDRTGEDVSLLRPEMDQKKPTKEPEKDVTEGDGAADPSSPITEPSDGAERGVESSVVRVLGILIQSTDRLKTKLYISHPLVKVHLLNAETGQPLPKSLKSRPVSYHLDGQQVGYILPLMTKPCDFRSKGLSYPVWDELLLFNEPFAEIFQSDRNILFIFELLDFASMTATRKAQQSDDVSETSHGWHRIAWCFWKPQSFRVSGTTNTKLRMQLFRAPRTKRQTGEASDVQEVFYWWKDVKRIKYSGSLFVTVKPLVPPKSLRPAGRSIVALQKEEPHQDASPLEGFDDPSETVISSPRVEETAAKNDVAWSRIPGQPCKIPNKCCLSLFAGKFGCVRTSFSPDGRTIACSAKDGPAKFPILLYEIPDGRLRWSLVGHLGLVYSFNWSQDSDDLLSASADSTARIWKVSSGLCVQILPHAYFVYCAAFLPRNEMIVLTGSYDKIIRIWMRTAGIEAQIMREVSGHSGYVNCMVVTKDSERLITGDSQGCVKFWNIQTSTPRTEDTQDTWHGLTINHLKDLKGHAAVSKNAVNCLLLQPSESLLYVHSRDNCIRCFDNRMSIEIQKMVYQGGIFSKMNIVSDITPCGRYLLSGSEDGRVLVWNTSSGVKVLSYNDEKDQDEPVMSVSYHPFDHIMAVGGFGPDSKLKIYNYDPNEVELHAEETEQANTNKNETNADSSYLDFSIQKLLSEHNIQLKLNSVEKQTEMLRPSKPEIETLGDAGKPKPSPSKRTNKAKLKTVPKPVRQETEVLSEVHTEDLGVEMERGKPTAFLRAIYDYRGDSPDDLSFSKNDIIGIVQKQDDNWWIGSKDGRQGYVPGNFVEEHFQ